DGSILAQVVTNVQGGLTNLFEIGGDAGSDGERSTNGTLSFTGIPQEGVATNLSATDGGAITLFLDGTRTILGKDEGGQVVFSIRIVDGVGGQQIETTLYEAVQHSDANLFDGEAI